MSECLANELVDSLKEYAAKIDETYRERQICTFDWYSIGSYVYSFVSEIDTLMRCY